MIGKQDQAVGQNAEAYQAGGSITVNKGMTPAQMGEFMIALAGQLRVYQDEADQKAETRYRELRESLINEFAQKDSKSESAAFAEPDFQRIVQDAHESFAHSGDETLKKELVRLLTERSAQKTGSRVSLVLNEAIRTAGRLTKQEHAALAITFLFKYVRISGTASTIKSELSRYILSFLPDLPSDEGSYDYLETMRCASVNPIITHDFWEVLRKTYGNELSDGFRKHDLEQISGYSKQASELSNVFKAKLDDYTGKLVFSSQTSEDLNKILSQLAISTETTQQLVSLFERVSPDRNTIKEFFESDGPEFVTLVKIWDETPLKSIALTSLGKALAHSALVSRNGFDAPIEIWIK